MVNDPEVFYQEIQEQKWRFEMKEKLKKLEAKDLVSTRENEDGLFYLQKKHFNEYNPLGPIDETAELSKEFEEEVNRVVEENEKRKQKLLSEGRAILEQGFNRII